MSMLTSLLRDGKKAQARWHKEKDMAKNPELEGNIKVTHTRWSCNVVTLQRHRRLAGEQATRN